MKKVFRRHFVQGSVGMMTKLAFAAELQVASPSTRPLAY